MKFFIVTLIFIITATLFFAILSLIFTASDAGLNLSRLCITSACINNFDNYFSGSIKILKFGISAIWIFVLISGVYIALQNYLTSVKSSALSGHISHITMFKDYIDDEIKKLDSLQSQKINIFIWYRLAFPLSSAGNVEISENYKYAMENIIQAVTETNNSINSPKGEFGYKIHQERIINAMKCLGIDLSFMRKNEFNEVENDLFKLIDSVNQTFSSSTNKLLELKRDYI